MVNKTGRPWGFMRNRGVRAGVMALAAALVLLVVTLATSPLWLTPLLERERPALERTVSSAVRMPVHIKALAARVSWRPSLIARGISVEGTHGPAIRLRKVRVQLSWLALMRGHLWPAFVGVTGGALHLIKTPQGFRVAGLTHHAGGAFHWRSFLRRSHFLKIRDSHIKVTLSVHRALTLEGLEASWAYGLRAPELKVAATIPGVCVRCQATVHLASHALRFRPFSGALAVALKGLDLHAATSLMPGSAQTALKGQVDGQLWTRWRDGHMRFVGGKARLAHAFLPATSRSQPVSIARLKGRFSLKIHRHAFRFYATHLVVIAAHTRLHTNTLQISHMQGVWRLKAGHLMIAQVAYFVRHIQGLPPSVVRLAALRPVGQVQHVSLMVHKGGHWHYHVRTHFSNVGLGLTQGPRFAHAAGTLVTTTTKGSLVITALHGQVRGPALLPGPLFVRAFHTSISWRRGRQGFSFQAPVFHLASTVGSADAVVSASQVTGQGPVLALSVALADVPVKALGGLYPHSLDRHLRHWLTRTLQGGVITRGQVHLAGPLDQFPFRRGGGVFRVRLHVKRGRYRFLPRWPMARDLDVTVTQKAARLVVAGSGKLGALVVPQVRVEAGPLGTPGGQATVRIVGRGGLGGLLHVVLPHVRHHLRRFIPLTVTGHGPIHLGLLLHIPFSPRHEPSVTLTGRVRLLGAGLHYPLTSQILSFKALYGVVGFTEQGPKTGRVQGTLLGGPLTLGFTPHKGGVIAQAQGAMSAAGVRRLLGAESRYVTGPVPWTLHVVKGARMRIAAQADLRHAAVHLPYPAGKSAGAPGVVSLHWLTDTRGTFVSASLPSHVRAAYAAYQGKAPGAWIGVGPLAPPATLGRGLAVNLRSGYVNALPWLRLANRLRGQISKSRSALVSTMSLRSVQVFAGSLFLAKRGLGAFRADFTRAGSIWQGVVSGSDVQGAVGWRSLPKPTLSLRLTKLVIPKGPPLPKGHGPRWRLNPSQLPIVHFITNSLTVHGYHVGRVAIDGAPYSDGFQFGRVWIAHHHTKVTGQGQWTRRGGRQESLFTLALQARNLGHALDAWGLPHQLAGGRTTAHGTLNWPGAPPDFSLAKLEAKIQFFVSEGRFLKVRQGAGKLLGIFNVDSIARYLTLDFSNIFGRGFSFNHIDGKLTVEQGAAMTHRIGIDGASAHVVVSGTAGLVAQTFDLKLQVNPHLQNNVTLATGLLGGPVAGAAALLMQKIFAHEINQGTRLTYLIKGPWSHPIVSKKADKD